MCCHHFYHFSLCTYDVKVINIDFLKCFLNCIILYHISIWSGIYGRFKFWGLSKEMTAFPLLFLLCLSSQYKTYKMMCPHWWIDFETSILYKWLIHYHKVQVLVMLWDNLNSYFTKVSKWLGFKVLCQDLKWTLKMQFRFVLFFLQSSNIL